MGALRQIVCSLAILLMQLAVASCTVSFTHTPGDDDAGLDDAVIDDADPGGDVVSCVPTENVELTCDDGLDNDCDGATDCDDPHCGALPCDDGDPTTMNDTCHAGVCVGQSCVPTENVELTCDDGVDNDCVGGADCADTAACEGASCDDGDSDTDNDRCTSSGTCEGEPCEQVWICDQCGTGNCHDVLIAEDAGCGCASSVPISHCNNLGITYDVDCGDGTAWCTYERQEITEDCNCRWECQ